MQHGRIQQQGEPSELYERPANRFVAGFIGSSNFIPSTVVRRDGSDSAVVETQAGLQIRGRLTDPASEAVPGAAVTLAVRPERLRVEPAADGVTVARQAGWTTVPGRIAQGTYLGESTEYRISTESVGELMVRLQNTAGEQAGAVGPGQPVVVRWPDDATLVLTS
jgi:ABC-type Fe3+/spermidine/putrescine transport system ATPase subunit